MSQGPKVLPLSAYVHRALQGKPHNAAPIQKKALDMTQPIFIESDLRQMPGQTWTNILLDIVQARKADQEKSHFWATMARRIMAAQQFDFGLVEDTRIKAEAFRAGPLFGQGMLDLPYESAIYNYTLQPDPDDEGTKRAGIENERFRFTTLVCKIQAPVFLRDPVPGPGYIAADFIFVPKNEWEGPPLQRKYGAILAGAAVFQSDIGEEKWKGRMVDQQPEVKQRMDHHDLVSLADGVGALSMILATKGVPLHKVIPSEKQQRARVKKGRPLLPVVTKVDTHRYYEAMQNTEKGTHASPVPHLRRGHIRNLADGRQTWVRDTIVNCRSLEDVVDREKYEVES